MLRTDAFSKWALLILLMLPVAALRGAEEPSQNDKIQQLIDLGQGLYTDLIQEIETAKGAHLGINWAQMQDLYQPFQAFWAEFNELATSFMLHQEDPATYPLGRGFYNHLNDIITGLLDTKEVYHQAINEYYRIELDNFRRMLRIKKQHPETFALGGGMIQRAGKRSPARHLTPNVLHLVEEFLPRDNHIEVYNIGVTTPRRGMVSYAEIVDAQTNKLITRGILGRAGATKLTIPVKPLIVRIATYLDSELVSSTNYRLTQDQAEQLYRVAADISTAQFTNKTHQNMHIEKEAKR